jgi:hypothetical protein
MPIERVKKSVVKGANKIRHHWSRDETLRRQQMAEIMQMRLISALGFQPALNKKYGHSNFSG